MLSASSTVVGGSALGDVGDALGASFECLSRPATEEPRIGRPGPRGESRRERLALYDQCGVIQRRSSRQHFWRAGHVVGTRCFSSSNQFTTTLI